jgi:hypothetical protein
MLKALFDRLIKPLPTDWEKFSQRLKDPEKYLTPALAIKLQDYSRHPVHSHALEHYAAAISGNSVCLLAAGRDRVEFHARDRNGKYTRWEWVASVEGVIGLHAKAGIGTGQKSADTVVQDLSQVCFYRFIQTSPAQSAERLSVQKALNLYNRTMPRFAESRSELKIGSPY